MENSVEAPEATEAETDLDDTVDCPVEGAETTTTHPPEEETAEEKDDAENAVLEEPVFTLRAQDRMAPDVVQHWIEKANREGVPLAKIRGASEIMLAMRAWQKANPTLVKVPD